MLIFDAVGLQIRLNDTEYGQLRIIILLFNTYQKGSWYIGC